MQTNQEILGIGENIAGPQGSISSRTTITTWLGRNPWYNQTKFGRPIAFGCDICKTLRVQTLEEALAHAKSENRTVRSEQWKHTVVLVAEQVVYTATAQAIIDAEDGEEPAFSYELSELKNGRFHPECGGRLIIDRAYKDEDNDVTHYDVTCSACKQSGVLLND